MSHILVVTGSARPNSANTKVVEAVKENLSAREGVEVSVADLVALNLPFMNAPMPPSQPAYEITEESVKQWADMVSAADGVVFVMPEYNHSMTAIQKNAIDWLYKEWVGKPVALVAYGFYAGRHAIANFEEINLNIKTKLDQRVSGLQFDQEINFDGSIKDSETVTNEFTATFDALLAAL